MIRADLKVVWLCFVGCAITAVVALPMAAQMPGQSMPVLPPVNVSETPKGFSAVIGDESLRVEVCSASGVHVVTRRKGEDVQPAQPWLLPGGCAGAKFSFAKDATKAEVKTERMTVALSLDRGSLSYSTADGKGLLREGNALPRAYTAEVLNGSPTYHVVDRFSPDFTEAFYGLGQHQNGMFNYRGATVELAQNNTDIAIPLLVSTRGYGVLWNTASLTYVDNRFPLELKFDSMAGAGVDYFVLYGPEMDGVIHEYRERRDMLRCCRDGLMGLFSRRTGMFRWMRFSRSGKDIARSIFRLMCWCRTGSGGRRRAIRSSMRTTTMLWAIWRSYINRTFRSTMISTWGLIDPLCERRLMQKRLRAENLFVADARVYDATNPRARDVYWENLPGKLFEQGWDSFWLDSAEPEEYWPHLGDAILKSRNVAIGNGAEYTNVYPLLHNLGIQENWRKTTDKKRVFLLTRSAFLGQQRVGGTVLVWGCVQQLLGVVAPDCGGAELCGLGTALLDYGYWRILADV